MAKENNLTITHPELCKEWDYEKNEKKPENYTYGSHAKVFWILNHTDLKTGKTFVFRWSDTIVHRTINNRGCPYLSGQAIYIGFNDLSTTNPEIAKQWDYEKNFPLTPQQVTACSGKKIIWKMDYIDPKTGKDFVFKWFDTIAHRTMENRGCPYLSGQAIYVGFNDLSTTNPEIAKQWDYEKNYPLTPQQVTAGSSKKAYFTCEKGHTYKTMINNRIKKGCLYCSASSAEKLIHSILDKNNIEFEIEKKFVEEVEKNPYDIFLSNENLCIELDGRQHFTKNSLYNNNNEDKFKKQIERDNKKNKYALENDIPLLRIPNKYFKNELKIEALVMDFIRTRVIPKEIIDFYREYEFSNYAELAEKYNEILKLKVS